MATNSKAVGRLPQRVVFIGFPPDVLLYRAPPSGRSIVVVDVVVITVVVARRP
jgi:hypothetical protein